MIAPATWRYYRQPDGGWTRRMPFTSGEWCAGDGDASATQAKHATDERCRACVGRHSHSAALHRASIEAANQELQKGRHE